MFFSRYGAILKCNIQFHSTPQYFHEKNPLFGISLKLIYLWEKIKKMEEVLQKYASKKVQSHGSQVIQAGRNTSETWTKNSSIKLQTLKQEIQNSKYILKLTNNWDENGALPISPMIYDSAIRFLQNYTLFIFKKYKTIIETPSINPVNNGSIDLEWHTPNARLLVNIRDTQNAYYYGDQHKNINSIKGSISFETIENFFAVWMTKLAR